MKDIWSKPSFLISVMILIMFVFAAIFLSSYYRFSPEGKFIQKESCYDTDGFDTTKKGAVTIFSNSEPVPELSKVDECVDGKLLEYFCDDKSRVGHDSKEIQCSCYEGKCID